jgi:hypothetical protein
MSRRPDRLGGPPELQNAIDGHYSYTVLPSCGIYRLLKFAQEGHGDYTWGYRIYRTTYLRPDSDTRFATALEVINEYIRYECSNFDTTNRPESVQNLEAKASEQLRQRLEHDIVQDRELLEGASEDPDKILQLAQDWVHLDQKATTGDGPRYRFFLVIDDEVIDHLLLLPMPANPRFNIPTLYSVKVYDARTGPPSKYSGGESDSDSNASSEDSQWEGFEGWFWSPACYLTELWFCDWQAQEELLNWDFSWDDKRRYIPSKAGLSWLPLNETIEDWRGAELQQEAPDRSGPVFNTQDTSD